MANVTLKNVKKIYDNSVTAVSDFCLDIKDKEFVVFVGPSGCGKTTTLRMVAGLEDITEGDLYIDDKRMNNIAPKDRDIAMVFQNYALYPHMTVYENMAFALKLRKIPKSEINLKVHKAAEILGIEDLLNRKPKALSGGQRQRVAIGRAIVREPKVFLMDEPLSNLDAKLRGQMRTELIKLRGKINATFVYVTHDQTEAMTLGDRIVIMKDGFIQQIGTPQSLFDEPANLFVAGFIGTPQMNFLPATLNVTNGHYYTTVFGRDLSLSSKMQEKLTRNKQEACNVFVGIRPEHLSIASEGADRSLKAKIDVSEMMGSEVYLHTNIEETDIVLRVPTQDMAGLPLNLGKDNYISFVLPENFMHLFNAESGNSLFADNIS